jgi:hypothetical protein
VAAPLPAPGPLHHVDRPVAGQSSDDRDRRRVFQIVAGTVAGAYFYQEDTA